MNLYDISTVNPTITDLQSQFMTTNNFDILFADYISDVSFNQKIDDLLAGYVTRGYIELFIPLGDYVYEIDKFEIGELTVTESIINTDNIGKIYASEIVATTITANKIIGSAQEVYNISASQIVGEIPIVQVSTVNAQNIAVNAIDATKITDNTIIELDIQDDAVNSLKIKNATITSKDFQTGAITTDEILNDTILSEDISDSKINFDKLNISKSDIESLNYIPLDEVEVELYAQDGLGDIAQAGHLIMNNHHIISINELRMSNIEHEDINAASIQQLNYDQALSAGDFGYDQDFLQ